jgi:hypothetical protein
MGWDTNKLDPRLRARVEAAMSAADEFTRDIESAIPKPKLSGNSGQLKEVGKGGLQEQIQKHCAAQWPPWKIIQARTDKKSTIGEGIHDMSIYACGGRVFNIECKAKGKKPSPKQREWSAELRKLGHTVHFVWSLKEFLEIVNSNEKEKQT